jgi:hypothetical protein
LVNAAYLQLIGHRPVAGLTVREAIPEAEHQGFIDRLPFIRAARPLLEKTSR